MRSTQGGNFPPWVNPSYFFDFHHDSKRRNALGLLSALEVVRLVIPKSKWFGPFFGFGSRVDHDPNVETDLDLISALGFVQITIPKSNYVRPPFSFEVAQITIPKSKCFGPSFGLGDRVHHDSKVETLWAFCRLWNSVNHSSNVEKMVEPFFGVEFGYSRFQNRNGLGFFTVVGVV